MSVAALLMLAAMQHQHHPGVAMPAAKPAPATTAKRKPQVRTKPPATVKAKPGVKARPAAKAVEVDHGEMGPSTHGAASTEKSAPVDHSAMGHAPPAQPALDAPGQDHTAHGATSPAVDHSAMHHGAAPAPGAPSPAAAGSGPPRAADAIWGPDAMRASRDALRTMHGGQTYSWFQGDRLEVRTGGGREGYLWDLQGYYGGDTDKLFFKSEGEGDFGDAPEQAEVQALWSHAIGPWFDVQTGIRHDFAGPDRTHLAIGVQGLAPYQFEIDAAAFLSDRGELSARIEGELDQRITQRLRLTPRAEVNLSAQDVPERGIGAGIDEVELGLRLRYEIVRELAPYIGVEQVWRTGAGARYARAGGDAPSATYLVAGVRFWF